MRLFKRLVTVGLSAIMILGTCVTATAYSSSTSGTWDTGVTWDYNSSGTLTINGTDALDSNVSTNADTVLVSKVPTYLTDVTSIYFNEVNIINGSVLGTTKMVFGKHNTFSETCTALGGLKEFTFGEGLISITNGFILPEGVTKVTLPDGLTTLGSWAFLHKYYQGSYDNEQTGLQYPLKVTIPASVTSISAYAFGGDLNSVKTNLTVVCETGTEAFNWATTNGCNVELVDASTSCEATLNNDINWSIITPEDVTFQYSSEGWVADTFIGITGSIATNNHLVVQTDAKVSLVGATNGLVIKADVLSEDVNTEINDAADTYTTTLTAVDLANATEKMGAETGYKISFNYKTKSNLARQTYKGKIKFLISEQLFAE